MINLKDWPSFLASQSEGRTVLYDPSATPAPLGRALSTFQTTLKEGPDPCLQKRAIKNTVELEQMRLSHIYDAVALVQFFWWLKTEARAMGALSEWDAALYLESLKQANPHYGGQSFETIASSGAHTALIHYSPSATVVLDTYATSGEGFIAIDSIQTPPGAIRLAAPSSIEGFARDLYSALRFADAQGLTKVCVIQPEGPGLAAAIRDRLKRAAN